MTRKLVVTLCLLSFSLSAQCFAGPEAWCFAEFYKKNFKSQLLFIIEKHPGYLSGGAANLDDGVDCSGYVYLAARWAGVPGVTRTTSFRMSLGLGGWTGRDVRVKEAADCDLIFWTFDKKRPCGHVGVFLRDSRGQGQVTHASYRRGVVLQPLKGELATNLSKVRRLDIGD